MNSFSSLMRFGAMLDTSSSGHGFLFFVLHSLLEGGVSTSGASCTFSPRAVGKQLSISESSTSHPESIIRGKHLCESAALGAEISVEGVTGFSGDSLSHSF